MREIDPNKTTRAKAFELWIVPPSAAGAAMADVISTCAAEEGSAVFCEILQGHMAPFTIVSEADFPYNGNKKGGYP